MKAIKKSELKALSVEEAITKCLNRVCTNKDAPYFHNLFLGLVKNNAIPVALLDSVPVLAEESGKTRFDQIYEASMYLAFPGYRQETLEKLLGFPELRPDMKIWRVIIPERYRIANVLIRADTYQEAFSLACDYVCRVSLRLYQQIPTDLTIRVLFMGEKAVRRYLGLRWANRVNKRKQLQLIGREFTPKQVGGARLAALGHPSNSSKRSIAKYIESKDLEKIRLKLGKIRVSEIESETMKKP